MDIKNKIKISEKNFTRLFSNTINIDDNTRYYDDEIKNMYDHNFFELHSEMNDELFAKFLDIKKERKETFMEITSANKSEYLIKNGFKEETILTLVKQDYQDFNILKPMDVRYIRYKENPKIIQDVIDIEIKYYGPAYGEDFCKRRWLRYKDYIDSHIDTTLDIWVIYDNDIAIGYCYSYLDKDVVGMDGLIIIEEYRNKHLASNLIKHIAQYYKCPIYLHADEQETAKEVYFKLGFKIIDKYYYYLKVDK